MWAIYVFFCGVRGLVFAFFSGYVTQARWSKTPAAIWQRHHNPSAPPAGPGELRGGSVAKPSGVASTRTAPVPVPGFGASLGGSEVAVAGEALRAVAVPCEEGEGHGAAGGVRRGGAGPLPPSPSRCCRGRGVAAVSPR